MVASHLTRGHPQQSAWKIRIPRHSYWWNLISSQCWMYPCIEFLLDSTCRLRTQFRNKETMRDTTKPWSSKQQPNVYFIQKSALLLIKQSIINKSRKAQLKWIGWDNKKPTLNTVHFEGLCNHFRSQRKCKENLDSHNHMFITQCQGFRNSTPLAS